MLHEAELKAWRDEQARLDDAELRGRTEGRTKGRAEGIREERVTIAQNMLKRSRPIVEIAEDTGLSYDEIKKLAH